MHFRRKNSIAEKIIVIVLFAAYRKTAETDEILKKLVQDEIEKKSPKIRCPLCEWTPSAADRWFCSDCDAPEFFYDGCGTCWNTFQTGGICPTCGHKWRYTSCLRCGGWSKHEDWYGES